MPTPERRTMSAQRLPRRTFLKIATLGVSGVGLTGLGCAKPVASGSVPGSTSTVSPDEALKLGVASYSLRNFSRQRAIEMTRSLGVRYINFKSMHLPY